MASIYGQVLRAMHSDVLHSRKYVLTVCSVTALLALLVLHV